MEQYKISVIFPFYNVEKYISDSIESIIGQTYKNLEIICINDGSLDNSRKIVEKYAKEDSRIVIVDRVNGGLATARNTGLQYASGDFVSFVDSDDTLVENAYERIISCFTEDIDVVWFEPLIRYESYKIFQEWEKSDKNWYNLKYKNKVLFTDDMLLKVDCNAWSKMIRLNKFRDSGVFFPDGLQYEDAVFHFNLFSILKNVFFLKEKLYIYNRRSESIMSETRSKKPKYAINHIYVLDKIYDFWEKNSVLCGREQIFQNIIVQYFKNAMRHVPNFEQSHVLWELTKRLRVWNLGSNEIPLIKAIKHGLYNINYWEA